MAKLILMCERRTVLAVVADKFGDHYHGDVIDILPDYAVTDHYHQSNPFLVVSVTGDRSDFEYLLEPLVEQVASDEEAGPASLLRKRYGLVLNQLPAGLYAQLLACGAVTISAPLLESIIESRSME